MGIFNKKTRTPADVQADIDALNAAIESKESAIKVIEDQLRGAVAAGDMDAADGLDGDIAREQQALDRLRSRSTILADALALAEDEAANGAAKAEQEKATAAQAIGHGLLRDYEKQAKALGSTLGKLAAIERFIENANDKNEGRAAAVESVYRATRYKPAQLADGVERWYEYPGHGPTNKHLDPWLSRDGETYNRIAPPPLFVGNDESGEPIYVEPVLMKRTVQNAIPIEQHQWARAIDEIAQLPGAGLDDLDIWNATRRREAQMKAAQIVGALIDSGRRHKAA